MSFRDPRDVRRMLGKHRDGLRRGTFRAAARGEGQGVQLVLAACARAPRRCPVCMTELKSQLRCWACEAFACALCERWSEHGDGRLCTGCCRARDRATTRG